MPRQNCNREMVLYVCFRHFRFDTRDRGLSEGEITLCLHIDYKMLIYPLFHWISRRSNTLVWSSRGSIVFLLHGITWLKWLSAFTEMFPIFFPRTPAFRPYPVLYLPAVQARHNGNRSHSDCHRTLPPLPVRPSVALHPIIISYHVKQACI